jgi:sugar phosphate isomerase/epimerase
VRLGGIALAPQTIAEIEAFCEQADRHGLSATVAPKGIATMSEDEAAAFGQAARAARIVIGEAGFWENLIIEDTELRRDRLLRLRKVMKNADAMGCRSVAILSGTRHPSDKAFAAHPYMFTDACRKEVREIVLSALDGFDSRVTRLGMEPYAHSFFYGPEAALEFIESVGHPLFGIHLDQANMISHQDFFNTTDLVHRTFAALRPHMVSVHLKDIAWPVSPLGLKWEEVNFGEGVMDFDAYLRQISTLDPDISCFCEHFPTLEEYALNFARVHDLAAHAGTSFIRRTARQ